MRSNARIAPVVVGCSLLAFTGCGGSGVAGSGVAKTESRSVATFDAVAFSGAGSLEITISADAAADDAITLEVTADDNLLPLLVTEVSKGRLEIRPREEIGPKTAIVVKATVRDLREAALTGATRASIVGVNNDALRLSTSGAADALLKGRTRKLDVELSGAGAVNAANLNAAEVRATCIGAGSIDLCAEESLTATVTGAGSITYAENPKALTRNVTGIGAVRSRK